MEPLALNALLDFTVQWVPRHNTSVRPDIIQHPERLCALLARLELTAHFLSKQAHPCVGHAIHLDITVLPDLTLRLSLVVRQEAIALEH